MYIADTFYDIKVNYTWLWSYTHKKRWKNKKPSFYFLNGKMIENYKNRKIIFNGRNKTV